MTGQFLSWLLFVNVFSEKDPHLNAVEQNVLQPIMVEKGYL